MVDNGVKTISKPKSKNTAKAKKFVDADMREDLCRHMDIFRIKETGQRKYVCNAAEPCLVEEGPCINRTECVFYGPMFKVHEVSEQDLKEFLDDIVDDADEELDDMELERLRQEYASTTGDTSDYAFSHWYGDIILTLARLQADEDERAERERDPCDDCYNWDYCEYCKNGGNGEWN